MDAFVCDREGFYLCGIGNGKVHEPSLECSICCRNIVSDKYHVVGLYSKVEVIEDGSWRRVRTKNAILIPPENVQLFLIIQLVVECDAGRIEFLVLVWCIRHYYLSIKD